MKFFISKQEIVLTGSFYFYQWLEFLKVVKQKHFKNLADKSVVFFLLTCILWQDVSANS